MSAPERVVTWTLASLGEILEVRNGFAFQSTDYSDEGVPLVRQTDLCGNRIELSSAKRLPQAYLERYQDFKVKKGDLLIGMSGSLGKIACYMHDQPALQNQRTGLLRISHEVSRSFVSALFEYLTAEFIKRGKGVAVQNISAGEICEMKFLLPPAAEQQRIADAVETHISRLDAAVANLERVQTKLKAYRASVLKAAVEGRLVPTEAELARQEKRDDEPASVLLARILKERRRRWEEAELARLKKGGKTPKDDTWKAKYEEPEAPDTSKLPALPEGWCWASVEQLGDVVTGTTPQSNNADYYNGDIPFFKPTDLDAGENVVNARQYLTTLGAAQARLLPADTVLVTCIGATIGKVGLARVPCTTNQQINAWVPDEPVRVSRYGFWFFTGPNGRKQVIENSSSTTLPILNKSRFLQIVVPLPPMDEQERIVAEVEKLISIADETHTRIKEQVGRAVRLRQSILKWAFEGKLVDQDPNDEPAEELLARIRAERAATTPAKKTRGRTANTEA